MRARSAPTRYCSATRCRVSFFFWANRRDSEIRKFGEFCGPLCGSACGLGGRERKKLLKRELPNPRIFTPAQTAEFPNFRICAHRPTISLG
jgi:hypothetical protein